MIALAGLNTGLTSLQPDALDNTLSISRSAVPVIVGMAQLVFGVLVDHSSSCPVFLTIPVVLLTALA